MPDEVFLLLGSLPFIYNHRSERNRKTLNPSPAFWGTCQGRMMHFLSGLASRSVTLQTYLVCPPSIPAPDVRVTEGRERQAGPPAWPRGRVSTSPAGSRSQEAALNRNTVRRVSDLHGMNCNCSVYSSQACPGTRSRGRATQSARRRLFPAARVFSLSPSPEAPLGRLPVTVGSSGAGGSRVALER